MESIISAIGTANPEYRFPQQQILNFMIDAHQLSETDGGRLRKLYDASGIAFRHSVIQDFGVPRGTFSFFGNDNHLSPFPDTKKRSELYEKTAKKIALEALQRLFQQRHILPTEITHLITVSCTGMYAPGLDIDLIQDAGLNPSIERTCINFMGCYGAFNGLKTADYICRADHTAKVLMVDVELCTLHFQRESTLDNWIANSLFADGAAAVLVESTKQASITGLILKTFYNTIVPEAKDEMAWRIGNSGFEMRLSSQIAKNIGRKINHVADQLIQKAGLAAASITQVAIHPGGRRILEVCEENLNLPEEALQSSYDVLRQFGNMSSVTILFVLQRLLQKIQPGEKAMSFAFGPGLTVESMILEAA
ncbi:type III polyketide synthase [Pedobacter sp. SYSU D00535]|uniref:type III polyketide synthase n=1 Tax=Pedobacter sp. SYSU D00535 TaxID=2810308 RepID=UPI001A978640|nr:type III polyketide synthase [Pedobacter sp. SYSU D00535]